MMKKNGLLGLVMAGGKSSRMGCDKALLKLPTGQTMLERAFSTLEMLTEKCLVSCARGKTYAGYACLEDKISDHGPLAGICNGLTNAAGAGCEALLVLACDLPLIDFCLLQELCVRHFSFLQTPCLSVYQSPVTGKLEMLAGVYSVECQPILEKALCAGKNSLRRIIPEERQNRIIYNAENSWKFMNCNTREDICAAMEILKRRGPESPPL